MGSVRTEQIKRTAKELIRRYPDRFSGSFDDNKRMVGSLILGATIKVRNQIAGYITRSMSEAEAEQTEEVEEETE